MRLITELQWYEFENANSDGSHGSRENGCRISNDPESKSSETKTSKYNTTTSTRHLRSPVVSAQRQLKTCNITQYMCSTTAATTSTPPPPTTSSRSNATNTNTTSASNTTTTAALPTNGIVIEAMEVLYEYELYYNQYIDIHETIIPYLEESIIVNLASQMGIQQQCRTQNRRRQQQQQQQQRAAIESTNATTTTATTTIGHQFIGIQTKPYDRINPKYTTCQYPIPGTVPNPDMTIVCLPMLGGVTVFVQQIIPPLVASSLLASTSSTVHANHNMTSSFSHVEQEMIRTTVISYLKDAMDHDVFVVPNSITKLVYVGNSSNNSPNGGDLSSSAYSDQSIKTGWLVVLIGLLLCIAILIGCCCFFFCCCCRKRRKQRQRPATENETNCRSTTNARSMADVTNRGKNVDSETVPTPTEGKQCLASLDSLALKGDADVETIMVDETAHENEIPTDSDSSGFDDDVPTTMMITGISNANMFTKRDQTKVLNPQMLVAEDGKDNTIHNDDASEELVGQAVVDRMEENETEVDVPEVDLDDAVDGESLIETMSEEMDLLDRLALQGRPPPYPSTPTKNTRTNSSSDLLLIVPTRSLSPTTISAASQGTSTYTGSRNIVGSPTTCSQITMPAGNLRNQPKRVTAANTNSKTRGGGFMKKLMMVPQQQRLNSVNNTSGSIRTAYTPDSFDEEILGITSDDSRDHSKKTNNHSEAVSTKSVPVVKHVTVREERHQYEQRHYPPTYTSNTTYPDVLDEHISYTFNENEEDDDLFSFQSDHNHETTTTATSNAVQRHLQMS